MTEDKTEYFRKAMAYAINNIPNERKELEAMYGKVWDTKELQEEFEVLGFMAPYVAVMEKATSKKGSMLFQNMPRFYFSFREHKL